jgi:hypothetical protein
MRVAFWEWMIRGDKSTAAETEAGIAELGLIMRDGKLKSGYGGPYRARDQLRGRADLDLRPNRSHPQRFAGRSDSLYRGEHEDHYDPDFCINNDLVVFGTAEQVERAGNQDSR